MDVSSAYLHAEIDHEIYQPPGFEKSEANNVCKLRQSNLWFEAEWTYVE